MCFFSWVFSALVGWLIWKSPWQLDGFGEAIIMLIGPTGSKTWHPKGPFFLGMLKKGMLRSDRSSNHLFWEQKQKGTWIISNLESNTLPETNIFAPKNWCFPSSESPNFQGIILCYFQVQNVRFSEGSSTSFPASSSLSSQQKILRKRRRIPSSKGSRIGEIPWRIHGTGRYILYLRKFTIKLK